MRLAEIHFSNVSLTYCTKTGKGCQMATFSCICKKWISANVFKTNRTITSGGDDGCSACALCLRGYHSNHGDVCYNDACGACCSHGSGYRMCNVHRSSLFWHQQNSNAPYCICACAHGGRSRHKKYLLIGERSSMLRKIISFS